MRITPKSIGTVRGSNSVPKNSPSAPLMMQASGTRVSRIGQLTSRCTGVAGTTVAIGNTISPANRHWRAPATIFSKATSCTGSGASTRSSISRV